MAQEDAVETVRDLAADARLYRKGIETIYAHNNTSAELPDTKPFKRPQKLVRSRKGETQSAGRTALRFTLCRVRLLDPCAKYGSCKALIDGLRYAGIIFNDREEDITLEVHQAKVAHFAEEKTVIEITYPN